MHVNLTVNRTNKEELTMKELSWKFWCNLAGEALKLSKYQQSLKYYNIALEISPNEHEIWNKKGWVLSKLKQYTEAIGAYHEANQILATRLTNSIS